MANDLFGMMDWEELRRQKAWLAAHDVDEAHGLLHLLDALQDYAVDEHGFGEYEVFGPSSECEIERGNTEPCADCCRDDCPSKPSKEVTK